MEHDREAILEAAREVIGAQGIAGDLSFEPELSRVVVDAESEPADVTEIAADFARRTGFSLELRFEGRSHV